MHTFVDRIFAINWSHHHIQWMLSTLRCGHDAGTGSTTDWDYERWRWSSRAGTAQHCQWSPASATAGTSKRGLARNRRLQSSAKWARLPIIGTYSCGDWCEIINPFLLTEILIGAHSVFEGYWIFIKYSVFKYCFLLKSHLWLIHNV